MHPLGEVTCWNYQLAQKVHAPNIETLPPAVSTGTRLRRPTGGMWSIVVHPGPLLSQPRREHTRECLPRGHERVHASMHFFIWNAGAASRRAEADWKKEKKKQSRLIPSHSTASKRNVIKATKSPVGPATCCTTNATPPVILRPTEVAAVTRRECWASERGTERRRPTFDGAPRTRDSPP